MTALLSHVQHLGVWGIAAAVADVAIVAYIIYRILLLIRGTGGAYMLIGLLVVAGVFLVASKLRLATLEWLLSHVATYAILIAIIVFQAEIRRGLTRVGRRMFLFSHGTVEASDIEEVVAACESWATGRIGALVVFEREADLSHFIHQAVVLEAKVSRALLFNIFAPWPDNPLHDGAALVKSNQIRQAAAVLPLSTNQNLDKALGTRHRAALGITEETDAVAVVVSEQRGVISLCAGGRILSNLSPAELRQELLTRLAVPPSTRWRWLGRVLNGVAAPAEPAPRRRTPTDQIRDEAIQAELRRSAASERDAGS